MLLYIRYYIFSRGFLIGNYEHIDYSYDKYEMKTPSQTSHVISYIYNQIGNKIGKAVVNVPNRICKTGHKKFINLEV